MGPLTTVILDQNSPTFGDFQPQMHRKHSIITKKYKEEKRKKKQDKEEMKRKTLMKNLKKEEDLRISLGRKIIDEKFRKFVLEFSHKKIKKCDISDPENLQSIILVDTLNENPEIVWNCLRDKLENSFC